MAKQYILVPEDAEVVSPATAAEDAQIRGIAATASVYGVSESTLRRFLTDAGWTTRRTTTWVHNSEEVVTGGGEEDDVVDPSRPG